LKHENLLRPNAKKNAPAKGLWFSINSDQQSRIAAATSRQTLQPGSGARLEAQTTRAAGHGVRGATQDTQALLFQIVTGRAARLASACIEFRFHRVLRNASHARILKAEGDALMSLQWQLCDDVGLAPLNCAGG